MRASAVGTVAFYFSGLLWLGFLISLTVTSAPGSREIWDDWYLLLVDNARDLDEVHSAITKSDGPGVLSLVNAEARYQGFPDLKTVAVRELPDRFDELDPRYDPYLRSLTSFFSVDRGGERYHLLFLERDRSTRALLPLLRNRLGGGFYRGWPATGNGWILVDAVGSISPLIAALFLLWAVGLLLFFRGDRLAGLPLLLSFLPAVGTGAVGTVAAGLLLFAMLHYLKAARRELRLRHEWGAFRVPAALRVPELTPTLWSVLAVTGMLLAAGVPPAVGIRVLATLLLAGAALLLTLVADDRRYETYEHHPFTFTSILTRRFGGRIPKPGIKGTVWGGGGLLLIVVTALLVPPYTLPEVPFPTDFAPESRTLAALDPLFTTGQRLGVPNGATYLAHRAYQDSISYGGTYRLPNEGETVVLPTYDVVDGRLEEVNEVVLTFDEEWVERTVESGREYLGVQTILLSEGVSTGVEQASFDRLYLSNFRPAPLAGAVLFAFSPFFLFGLTVARNLSVRSTKREA